MPHVKKLTDKIFKITMNVDSNILFEGMWPIPDGTSVSFYIVKGDEIAMIDSTFNEFNFPAMCEKLIEDEIGIKLADIQHIVVNHMEPDHSGWLGDLKHTKIPHAKLYCTAKAKPMLEAFYSIDKDVTVVKDGDTLDLGQDQVLTFFEAPNVHWPETMVTYHANEKTLFPCDAFGSHGRIEDADFDDELSAEDLEYFERNTLRYYANIVAAFSPFVVKAIEKLVGAGLDIQVIAPAHGIVWRKDPGQIIQKFLRFASYMDGPAESEITLVWASMYGNTKKIVNEVIKGIRSEDVPVHIFQVPQDDVGHVLTYAWRSTGIALGMPTYEYKCFPPMAYLLDVLHDKRVRNREVFRFGSFGWSGGAQKEMERRTEGLNWNFIDSLEWQGAPKAETAKLAFERGALLARKVKEAVKNKK